MEAIKRLAQWPSGSPEQWMAIAGRHLPPVVTAVLVIVIAYQAAALTWTLLSHEAADQRQPVVAVPTGADTRAPGTASTDLSALSGAHLFGRAEAQAAQPPPAVLDAPDTTLNLRLTGVIAFPDGEPGYAIIAAGRNEERYYVTGQAIEGANATLHSVLEDRVILNRGGVLETLRLPREPSGAAPSQAAARPSVSVPAVSAQVAATTGSGGSLREVVGANAERVSQIMRLAPHLEGGQMIGFRVNPGPNREAFAQLGLQPGDVVTDINGMSLDNPDRAAQLYESLSETTMANVTIMRDGAPQVIVIDTSELQNIADGLQ
jgi:general secretion pathway protein C